MAKFEVDNGLEIEVRHPENRKELEGLHKVWKSVGIVQELTEEDSENTFIAIYNGEICGGIWFTIETVEEIILHNSEYLGERARKNLESFGLETKMGVINHIGVTRYSQTWDGIQSPPGTGTWLVKVAAKCIKELGFFGVYTRTNKPDFFQSKKMIFDKPGLVFQSLSWHDKNNFIVIFRRG